MLPEFPSGYRLMFMTALVPLLRTTLTLTCISVCRGKTQDSDRAFHHRRLSCAQSM